VSAIRGLSDESPAISERNRTAVFSVGATSDRRFGWIPAAVANAGEDFPAESTRSSDAARLPIRNVSQGENRLKNRFNFVGSNGGFL
jgi:hypothetical protein